MPVKQWGGRTIVDLHWKGPKMFSTASIPWLPSYRGVYVIHSRKFRYDCPRGRSSVVYIGSGVVADRIRAHARRNPRIRDLLRDEGTLRVTYASSPQGSHPCVEQVLFDAFEERHGALPLLNKIRPPCSVNWNHMTVRSSALAFPHGFSRADGVL